MGRVSAAASPLLYHFLKMNWRRRKATFELFSPVCDGDRSGTMSVPGSPWGTQEVPPGTQAMPQAQGTARPVCQWGLSRTGGTWLFWSSVPTKTQPWQWQRTNWCAQGYGKCRAEGTRHPRHPPARHRRLLGHCWAAARAPAPEPPGQLDAHLPI